MRPGAFERFRNCCTNYRPTASIRAGKKQYDHAVAVSTDGPDGTGGFLQTVEQLIETAHLSRNAS